MQEGGGGEGDGEWVQGLEECGGGRGLGEGGGVMVTAGVRWEGMEVRWERGGWGGGRRQPRAHLDVFITDSLCPDACAAVFVPDNRAGNRRGFQLSARILGVD